MPIKIYKEKMEYLKKMLQELPQKTDPKDYHSTPNVTITWVENCSGKTKIREQELVSDENAHSTGFGKGVSPAHTFFAGFGFSHFTQWGRAAGVLDLEIDSLEEQVRGSFDRRGEYLYELGYEHKGFQEIAFEVRIQSKESKEKIREFISWADRSPPHATLRRAVRLIGIFYLNDQHIATAIYHPDRTEWRNEQQRASRSHSKAKKRSRIQNWQSHRSSIGTHPGSCALGSLGRQYAALGICPHP